ALRDEGPLVEVRVLRIMKQVCRSLREAHHLGVIHRDMKPGNILLVETADEPDTIKVLDFGLVKQIDDNREDLTQEGMFMGSPKYMAPEQILGNPVAAATDVYALGVVAYELLCGQPPFDDGTSVKTMMAHLHKAVPPLRERMGARSLSHELEAIVGRCLAKDPAERFDSMNALLTTLHLLDTDAASDSLAGPRVWVPTATGSERLVPQASIGHLILINPQGGDATPTIVTGPTDEAKPVVAATPRGPTPDVASTEAGAPTDVALPLERARARDRRRLLGLGLLAAVAGGAALVLARGEEPPPREPAGANRAKLHGVASPPPSALPDPVPSLGSAAPTLPSMGSDAPTATPPEPATTGGREPRTSPASSVTSKTDPAPTSPGTVNGAPPRSTDPRDTPPKGYKSSPY
ncbi:MAG: protein kinase, partial [Deltaproteobacteria bacterium]|nr:protein kinase [Deltaproteobacteria bacterium]